MSRKFAHHKYTWEQPFGSPRHMWQLVGPAGAIHFTASLTKGYGPSCGLEIHRRAPQSVDEAPSQTKCWLLGCACWHDGTSLYAEEHLWPIIESYLRTSDHETIFRLLEQEYDSRFRCEETTGAG